VSEVPRPGRLPHVLGLIAQDIHDRTGDLPRTLLALRKALSQLHQQVQNALVARELIARIQQLPEPQIQALRSLATQVPPGRDPIEAFRRFESLMIESEKTAKTSTGTAGTG